MRQRCLLDRSGGAGPGRRQLLSLFALIGGGDKLCCFLEPAYMAYTEPRRIRRRWIRAGAPAGLSFSLHGPRVAALAADHTVSAAAQYLRAAEYYRQAFFWHRDDLECKELKTAYLALVRAFRAGLPHLDRPGTVLDGDTPGYFFAPAGKGPFPTILHIGGYDGTAEETYPAGSPALDRGWASAGPPGATTCAGLDRP